MDFELDPDQELLRESVARFLADRAPIAYVRSMLDHPVGTTPEVWAGLAAIGVTGMLVPEAHGGAGMGMVDLAGALEETGRAVHPGPFLSHAVGAASLVTLAGSPEDHAALLPGIAAGTTVGTVALYEPGRRGAWAQPDTTADPDGDRWLVRGTKTHVPDAVGADVVLVTAAAPDGALAVVAVPTDAPGCTVTPLDTVDGTRKVATVTLDGALGSRLGHGDATDAVAATVDRIGVAMVVDGVGAASVAMELAVAYAKERHQFGKPIGAFQAVAHLCADMLRAVELGRAAAYYACWACDAADAAERHRAATMARAFAADSLYGVGANAIQVFGGIGFTWEHDAHLYYKRLLTLQHAGGGATDQLEELAAIVLD